MAPHSTNDVRAINRIAVLKQIARSGVLSRRALASRTGLTVAAISRISRELIDAGLLSEQEEPDAGNGRGRRTRSLQMSDASTVMIVMVISANRKAVAIANCRGDTVAINDLPDLDLSHADRAIDTLCDTATALLQEHSLQHSVILGVSVVVAINTNPANNDTVSSPVLKWDKVALKPRIEARLDLPVHLEARAVALLESELWHSPVAHTRSVVLINNGWRIGSCAHVNNSLVESAHGRLCQLAHLRVPTQDQLCYCGQTGCLDAVSSGAAIVNTLEQRGLIRFDNDLSLNQRMSLAISQAQHDASIADVFREAGEHLGTSLQSVLALYAPERILLAGATCRQPDYFDGVKSSLLPVLTHHAPCTLTVCAITSLEAAVITGLNAFLLSDALNISQLVKQQQSA